MTTYEVYYKKHETFRENKDLKPSDIRARTKYVLVSIKDGTKDHIFKEMQGDFMDKRTASNVINMIRTGETNHQSMSVGDVLRDGDTGDVYECAMVGWRHVK